MKTKFDYIQDYVDFEELDFDVTERINNRLNELKEQYTNLKVLDIKFSTTSEKDYNHVNNTNVVISILIYFQYDKEKEE